MMEYLTPPSFFAHIPYSEVLRRAELGFFPCTTIHHAQQYLGQEPLHDLSFQTYRVWTEELL